MDVINVDKSPILSAKIPRYTNNSNRWVPTTEVRIIIIALPRYASGDEPSRLRCAPFIRSRNLTRISRVSIVYRLRTIVRRGAYTVVQINGSIQSITHARTHAHTYTNTYTHTHKYRCNYNIQYVVFIGATERKN